MKLVIQIPCFNEAETLPLVFERMPKAIPGVDVIEFQIIDDGSTDATVEVARRLGVHHVVYSARKNRRWLGRAFRLGVDHALEVGADIVVNTDGDNQYPSERISELIQPILAGDADIVIGDRNPSQFAEFSWMKRQLQWLGSATIQFLTGSPVRDAVSGFRAYSREALLQIHPLTNFTYTVDTLIQAHKKGMEVAWLSITPNAKTRDSRLITSSWSKVKKSGSTILRMVTLYEPFKTFLWIATAFFVPGVLLLCRFLWLYFFVPGHATGHVQSVIAGGVCLVIAAQMFVLGLIADLLSANRYLTEQLLTRVRKLELQEKYPSKPSNSVEAESKIKLVNQ